MSIRNVLIVDDEPDIRELLEITLARMQINANAAEDIATAKTALANQRFDLCLTDMRLPDGSGLDIVKHIQQHFPDLPVAVITAYSNVEDAVQSLKAGAFDFVSKPVDLGILRRLIDTALKLAPLQAPENTPPDGSNLLGDSKVMAQLRGTIAKVARSQAPVYIFGESGSGKEVVAREIHTTGPRAGQPFIAVNCGAIPSELMESEFFGHKKGSFTGAITDKEGLFMAASGGTLFLDEVADLPAGMQVKLLRAIQERAIKPVGAHQETAVDARILSATHKNLAEEVSSGHFRQDLYYRINVIELRVPPLRERIEDIPLFAHHFLQAMATRWDMPEKALREDAIAALKTYPFPGNVRELENILERSATLCEGHVITAGDLILPVMETAQATRQHVQGNLSNNLARQEQAAILETLEATRWNQTAAARQLGLTPRQLRYRMHKFGIVR